MSTGQSQVDSDYSDRGVWKQCLLFLSQAFYHTYTDRFLYLWDYFCSIVAIEYSLILNIFQASLSTKYFVVYFRKFTTICPGGSLESLWPAVFVNPEIWMLSHWFLQPVLHCHFASVVYEEHVSPQSSCPSLAHWPDFTYWSDIVVHSVISPLFCFIKNFCTHLLIYRCAKVLFFLRGIA